LAELEILAKLIFFTLHPLGFFLLGTNNENDKVVAQKTKICRTGRNGTLYKIVGRIRLFFEVWLVYKKASFELLLDILA